MRITFQTKVLVPVLSILVLLMTLTTWIIDGRINQQFETDAQERLATANRVFQRVREMHEESLLSRYRNIPNEPRVKAVTSRTDRATLQDFCNKLLEELDPLGTAAVVFTSTDPDVPEVAALKPARFTLPDLTRG